ncbi:MAG TPA: hypothetical protein VGR58_12140 [Candidatus Acidoferrum sp.]|nr:hypothetical protein [Candidatus Acidoferrum sp.]
MWIGIKHSRKPAFRPPRFLRIAATSALLLFLPAAGTAKETLTTPGLVREFFGSLEEVRQAVQFVVHDQIIHGTLIFDKEPILNGAEAVNSTPLFDPWQGPGDVYFKIRKNAIAPRHFLDSGDQGTIAVRFVLVPVDANRTRIKIDAIYQETAHRIFHPSDGTVEKSEMKEIKDQLETLQEAAAQAADARRRQTSAELVQQSLVRQREDETSRISNAQSSLKDLERQVNALHHELERRVKAPGGDLKAAPFQSAATLKTLSAFTDVVILIVTPHWLGVETPDGQRGWLPEDLLEQLP